jgi:hypothetical protein
MFFEFITIILIDTMHSLCNSFYNISYSNTTRWFFLHSIINFIVVYYALPDLITCFINSSECYRIQWNYNSMKVYNYATLLHIYHCLFFRLTKDDYLHHFLMVIICGTQCYILKSIISSFALFFLTGLPGAIDYMLLYFVKMNKINSITEKRIYTFLSAYVRAPGCTYTLAIGMNGAIQYYLVRDYYKLISLLITILLIYWNGQYYFMKSHESYIRKI